MVVFETAAAAVHVCVKASKRVARLHRDSAQDTITLVTVRRDCLA